MKKKSLLTSTAAVLAICMLFSAGSVYARNGEGPGIGGPGEGMHQNWDEEGGPGPGPEGAMRGDKNYKGDKTKRGPDFEKLYKDIGVTEEQQGKLKEEREEHRKTINDLQKKLSENRKALAEELDKEKSDNKKLSAISDEMKNIMSEMVDQRLNSVLKIKEILTQEQYKKFVDNRKEHFKLMKKEMKKQGKKAGKNPGRKATDK